ncbi:hypothetical protein EJ07DRAFT_156132 [Lizonia empirigonia]|nr:hypothetical protein EJ07DRAFT_156132 [Lizonia empirigonia]
MGLCHERLLDLMACHWLGRLAKSRGTETEAGAMRTFQQSSSANCGESHLGATSSSASTPAHARTHDQRPPLRVARRFESPAARAISLLDPGALKFPPWLALQPPTSCCCPAIAIAAAARPTQPSQAPSHNIDCSFQRCAALLPCSTSRPTPSPQRACSYGSRTADAGPATIVHFSFQQHVQRVSVASCYQT